MAVTPDIFFDPEAVPLGLLRRYLLARGWRRAEAAAPVSVAVPLGFRSGIIREMLDGRSGGQRNFDQFVLSELGLQDVELVLPRETASPDYQRQIRGAIRTLSDLQERTPEEIIADVRQIGFDVMRSRIPDSMVSENTILLEVATGYITGVRSLLAATATTEIQPDPYFLRLKKEAIAFADGCRFGHTFRGSFGFTVESPVVPNNDPSLPFADPPRPFERRVMERMVRGVKAVCDAVNHDNPEHLIASAKKGFSANAYEQFAQLIEETALGGLAFSFALSSEWNLPSDLMQAPEYVVGPRHVEMTRAAAKVLRREAVPRAEKVIGRVVRLASEDDPSDLMNPMGDREIAIKWTTPEGADIHIRVALNPTDYLQAHAAHGAGRAVMVSGTLERRGRRWILSNPSDFGVQ